MKKLKNVLPASKALLYFGHMLTIASIFFIGIFTLVQLLLHIPLYIWLLPIFALIIGIHLIIKRDKYGFGYKFLDDDHEVIIIADNLKTAEKQMDKISNDYKYLGEISIIKV